MPELAPEPELTAASLGLETTVGEREGAKLWCVPDGVPLRADWYAALIRDIDHLAAKIVRLKDEMEEAIADREMLRRVTADLRAMNEASVSREAAARSEEQEASWEEGAEAVLKFIKGGRFLHDDAPTAQFAREVGVSWNAYGKAAAIRARGAEFPAADEFEAWVKEKHQIGAV